MNIDVALSSAIEPLVPEFAPDIYEGNATTFCTYNYSALPALHADSRPNAIVYLVQVHLYVPTGLDCYRLLINLKNSLYNFGCTYPSVELVSDKAGQHHVLECRYMDGDV